VTRSARPPPTDPPEPDRRALARIEGEARIAETGKLEQQGLLPAGSADDLREQVEWELTDEDGSVTNYWQNVDRDELVREWEQSGPLGPPMTPSQRARYEQAYRSFLDERIQDERTSPDRRFHLLRMRGALSQRAGELVGALLARARQARRSPRPREQRPRRSGRSSRDGPDEPPDDPDDLDSARRRSS
jgi:hypothetical protein